MRIATYNANSIRSRIDTILKWISVNEPDILAIQETKVQDSEFPMDAFADTGYHAVFRGQKKYNGVAFLSKTKPKQVVSHLEPDPKDEARLLKGYFGDITVINTYVPQGMAVDSEKFKYKLDWIKWFKESLEKSHNPSDLIVWLGDFNVAREDIDVHNPKDLWGHVCFCEPVQKAVSEVMEWGFVDIFRKLHPEPEQFSFWDYRVPNGFKRNIGWRLDYIMLTSNLADKCSNCWIDKEPRGWDKPSDHTFVAADFDI